MAPIRLVSNRQLEMLAEFAETHQDIVQKSKNGFLSHHENNRIWSGLAKKLNSVGGTIKTPDKWKRYWHMLKCRTKSKAADNRRRRRSQEWPEGEGSALVPLTDLEERIMSAVNGVKVEQRATEVTTPVKFEVVHTTTNEHSNNSPTDLGSHLEAPMFTDHIEVEAVCVKYEAPSPIAECSIEDAPTEENNFRDLHLDTQDAPTEESNFRDLHIDTQASTETKYSDGDGENKSNNEDPVPSWVYSMEERRTKAEERMADALVSLTDTNRLDLIKRAHHAKKLPVFTTKK